MTEGSVFKVKELVDSKLGVEITFRRSHEKSDTPVVVPAADLSVNGNVVARQGKPLLTFVFKGTDKEIRDDTRRLIKTVGDIKKGGSAVMQQVELDVGEDEAGKRKTQAGSLTLKSVQILAAG